MPGMFIGEYGGVSRLGTARLEDGIDEDADEEQEDTAETELAPVGIEARVGE